MKSITKLSILTVIVATFIACNNSSSNNQPAKLHRDTTNVIALYLAADSTHEVRQGPMKRVIADSFMYFDVDTITKKKIWIKDTGYLINYYLPIDSAISKKNNNVPIFDSVGKRILYPFVVYTDKRFVRSGWENVDSAVSELKRLK